ncbi:MAG: hypothetical protein IPK50_17065 [Fibrobacterota bacterium]|nr:hypothetical protein [Fibrobacterota bacterium]QQS03991.1 MAG: hypothetical protein IPK50_17065 [Fibrobacterota bacterium]
MIQILFLVVLVILWNLSFCHQRQQGVYGNAFFEQLDTALPLRWCSQSSPGGDYSAWARLKRDPRIRDSLIKSWKLEPQHGEARYQFEQLVSSAPDTTIHWYARPRVPEECLSVSRILFPDDCKIKEWAPHLQMWRGRITNCDWTFMVDDGNGLYLYGDVSQGCAQ